MEKGRALRLMQTPKAERYMGVAAASILARDIFLTRLARIIHEFARNLGDSQ